jgi:xylulokinase
MRHDRGSLARAVLEGVAYGLRDSLEAARVSGGASSRLCPKIVASVLGLPLERTECDAGAAFGAALLAGAARSTQRFDTSSRTPKRAVRAGQET